MDNIVLLSVAKLKAHPQNPRKDLGDLEELTESIKAKGILQPLTVVEDGSGSYKVIIGHRRLGAAIHAKLEKVPCVVRVLTEEEQLQIMLMENMQREDLNAFEQAQGFQLMLDAGIKAKEIAEQTGFSQKTVKQRAEWAKMDQTKLQKLSADNQLTITQLCEINEVLDLNERNKLLDAVGTKNFEYALRKAKDEQRYAELKKDWIKNLKTFAEKIEQADYATMTMVGSVSVYNKNEFKMPEDANEIRYFYVESINGLFLYKQDLNKIQKQNEQYEPSERQKKMNAIEEKIEQIRTKLDHQGVQFEEIRRKFINNYKVEDAEKLVKTVLPYMVDVLESRATSEDIDAMLPGYYEASEKDDEAHSWGFRANRRAFLLGFGQTDPAKTMLQFVYAHIEDSASRFYKNVWSSGHTVTTWNDSNDITNVYAFLESLGYQMADAERSLVVGNDPVFKELEDLEAEWSRIDSEEEEA